MSTLPISPRNRRAPLDLEKPLPQNLEAERAVLGAILLDNKAFDAAAKHVSGHAFFLNSHKRIFREMAAMAETQIPIDLVTLTDRLRRADELEAAGGAAYIAQLMDGEFAHSATNVESHAKIVHDAAAHRSIIHATHAIQQDAWNQTRAPDDLITEISQLDFGETRSKGLVADCLRDFLDLNFDPRVFNIDPILPVKGLAELHAPRGTGKTLFALELGYCIAAGIENCFVWTIPQARPVIYVDGEMGGSDIQGRLRKIVKGHGLSLMPAPDQFQIVTPDRQQGVYAKINAVEGQRMIERKILFPGTLLILDNLAALSPSSDEQETEDWALVQAWLLKLRRMGHSVLFLHHAGKSGTQRGTSKKEDLLDLVLSMRLPKNYRQDESLRAEISIEKKRGEVKGRAAYPFEVAAETVADAVEWTMKPLRGVLERQMWEMLQVGMKTNDIVADMGVSRFTVYRLQKKIADGFIPPAE